jgi:hypothetical protein
MSVIMVFGWFLVFVSLTLLALSAFSSTNDKGDSLLRGICALALVCGLSLVGAVSITIQVTP